MTGEQKLPFTPRKTDRRSVGILILGLAATAAWLFVFVSYFLEQKPNLKGGLADVQIHGVTESWMGFYQRDSPIGYNHEVIEPRGNEYFLTDEMVLKLNLLGQSTLIRMFLKSRLALDWSVIETNMDLNSGDMAFSARVTRVGDKLKVSMHTGGKRIDRDLALSQPPYLYTEAVLAEKLRQLGFKKGTKLSVPVFEPMSQALDFSSMEVGEEEKVALLSGEVSAYKVAETFKGQTEYMWITGDGEVVKETHPSGFNAFKVTREQALDLLSHSSDLNLDLISALAVPSNRYIENARNVKMLKAEIKGPSLQGLDLDGDDQKLTGRQVEIRMPEIPAGGYALPFSGDAQTAKYLESDWQAESNDPDIIAKTKEVLKGDTNSVRAVRKLANFVSGYVEDSMVATIPTAVEVLKQKKGACKEHTVLFTAMARAAGIPARMNAGLVYSDAYLIKGFYYHAWAEVYLADREGQNGKWIKVDPTFNQFPADATHIRLKIGDLESMIALMSVAGQTKIEVGEYQ